MKDYYRILEVNENASDEIIEKAYKTLVKKYHPDLYSTVEKKEAEQKLKLINEAYDILSDKFLKAQYDVERKKEKEQENTISNNIRQNSHNESVNVKKKHRAKKPNTHVRQKNDIGTIFGIVDLIKTIWHDKPKIEKRKMNQTDWLAIILTIIAVIVIGIILWFIPFTNGWMREFLFENEIFNFIGGIFS